MHIVVVTKDVDVCSELVCQLHRKRHTVLLVSSVDDARHMLTHAAYELLLIDLDLPDDDGLSLCINVYNTIPDTVIIVFDQGNYVKRRVLAFKSGADDVVQIPCDGDELLLRVQARQRQRQESQLKRIKPTSTPDILHSA